LNLNNEIEKRYKQWRVFSRGLHRSGDELLHTVLESVLRKRERLTELTPEQLHVYVCRALYLTAISPRSAINYKKAVSIDIDNCKECRAITDEVYMEYRVINEQFDVLIGRLPEYDAIIFRQYIQEGFSFDELSAATGINKRTLYESVKKSKQTLKQYV
jgi:DNA-directed RNA polymerase specialized sigma24 family protein